MPQYTASLSFDCETTKRQGPVPPGEPRRETPDVRSSAASSATSTASSAGCRSGRRALDKHGSIEAVAESIIGLFKTEVIRRPGPWRNVDDVETATLEWVDRFTNRRLLERLGHATPAEAEARFRAAIAEPSQTASGIPGAGQPIRRADRCARIPGLLRHGARSARVRHPGRGSHGRGTSSRPARGAPRPPIRLRGVAAHRCAPCRWRWPAAATPPRPRGRAGSRAPPSPRVRRAAAAAAGASTGRGRAGPGRG